jgi:hypothetical protein
MAEEVTHEAPLGHRGKLCDNPPTQVVGKLEMHATLRGRSMACEKCAGLVDIADLGRPHVVRTCSACGRSIKLRPTGKSGLGLKINKGDQLVVPHSFLKMAANPLKGGGEMSPTGLEWFAQTVFGVDISKPAHRENFTDVLSKIIEANEKYFIGAPFLADLDLDDPKNADEILRRIDEHPKTVEWWGYMAALFGSFAADAIREGDASGAAWAATASERFRSLAVFKADFADVVFMGHSAKRLVDLIKVWDTNKDNSNEDFWQTILTQHAYAFGQIFAAPVTFIEGAAYVGGQQLDRGNARYLDFMLAEGSSNHAILVEIKTPTTPLLAKQKYRTSIYAPSRDLGGSIVQVNDYLDTLRRDIASVTRNKGIELDTFNPRRVVLIGNSMAELTDRQKRSSFELYRHSLAGVDVITFDEFFQKIERLAQLFNIVRMPKEVTSG